jgi:alkanesulfonate monooxygenase SsuD/methylene tetrahydromethanopterin reductase-like flavin-dependent oxidoreductase (luciferase family)
MRNFGLQVGVLILPDHRWSVAARTWIRAEQLGFAHAWTYDHLTWRGHRDLPWFGAIPTLTAAAMATQSIALGTLVASPNFRHPVPFAKDLITLDDVSGGRLIAGIGAGADGWDTTMLGAPPWGRRERTERFEEFVHSWTCCCAIRARAPTAATTQPTRQGCTPAACSSRAFRWRSRRAGDEA